MTTEGEGNEGSAAPAPTADTATAVVDVGVAENAAAANAAAATTAAAVTGQSQAAVTEAQTAGASGVGGGAPGEAVQGDAEGVSEGAPVSAGQAVQYPTPVPQVQGQTAPQQQQQQGVGFSQQQHYTAQLAAQQLAAQAAQAEQQANAAQVQFAQTQAYAQAAQAHAQQVAASQQQGQQHGGRVGMGAYASPGVAMGIGAPMGDNVNSGALSVSASHVCPVCHDAFGDEQSLSRHAARSHARDNPQRGEPLQCPHCVQTLANPQNLRRHIAVCHTGAAAGQPHQVSRRHSTGGAVGKPGTSPGNKRPKSAKVFVCALCPAGTTFRWKGNLKRHHQLIHLQQKPFTCPICNESFGTKSNRQVHQIVHQQGRDGGLATGPPVQQQGSGPPVMQHAPNGMPGATVGAGQVLMPGNHVNMQGVNPGQQQQQLQMLQQQQQVQQQQAQQQQAQQQQVQQQQAQQQQVQQQQVQQQQIQQQQLGQSIGAVGQALNAAQPAQQIKYER